MARWNIMHYSKFRCVREHTRFQMYLKFINRDQILVRLKTELMGVILVKVDY